MTILDAIASLGLSRAGLARFLRANERTVRRWCDGDVSPPFAVTALLGLMIQHGYTPANVGSFGAVSSRDEVTF